jgi:hypothetical protein
MDNNTDGMGLRHCPGHRSEQSGWAHVNQMAGCGVIHAGERRAR